MRPLMSTDYLDATKWLSQPLPAELLPGTEAALVLKDDEQALS